MFEKNVGTIDRVIRGTIGLVVIGLGIYFQSWFGLLGLLPLGTAFFGRCSLYLPFGISTCSFKTQTEKSKAATAGR